MHQYINSIGLVLGGIGLFLLAVTMITDGLKLAAGNAIRDILGSWTRTPKHGIFTGISLTAIVQSSSAVTVATIGFVNAGLLSLYQAIGIIFGSNIGTTMTGWLVAIVGFKINVNAFALPMIGIGMLLRLVSGITKYGYFGIALTGFGLFFIGVDVLTQAFEGVTSSIDLQRFSTDSVLSQLLFVGIGAVMTIVTQSSSAAIALTLTAATGGVLDISAAAAMVIGANVGTTSTAALTVIGATSNARRVAAAHILFNIITAVIALLLLPVLLLFINHMGDILNVEQVPAVTLAIFHTVFNVLGVLIMWPISGWLTRYLEKRFISYEEIESRPQYLDKNILKSPDLAINATVLELIRVSSIVRRLVRDTLTWEKERKEKLFVDQSTIKKLCGTISDFISMLEKSTLTGSITKQLTVILKIQQHLLTTTDLAIELLNLDASKYKSSAGISNKLNELENLLIDLIRNCDIESSKFDLKKCESDIQNLYILHDDIKNTLLQMNADTELPIHAIIEILDRNKLIRRLSRQLIKSTRYLSQISLESETKLVNNEKIIEYGSI